MTKGIIKHFSAFSGYGGDCFALKKVNIEHKCVGFSEIDKYAIQCFQQNHLGIKNFGDITKIDWKEVPEFDLLTGGFPCFFENTKVYTQKGFVNIQDVIPGMKVLTHENTFKKVKCIMRQKFEGNKIKITLPLGLEEIQTTPEHPFLICENQKYVWRKASELKQNDYLVLTIPNQKEKYSFYSNIAINQNLSFKKYLPTDNPLFWYLIGFYIAEGWVRERTFIETSKNKPRLRTTKRIIFAVNEQEKDKILNLIKQIFKKGNLCKERTCYKVHVCSKELTEFVKQFGKGAKNKRIPNFVYTLPIEFRKNLIEGYFDGDGSIAKYGRRATTISKTLAFDMQKLMTMTEGKIPTIYKNKKRLVCYIESRKVNENESYEIRQYFRRIRKDQITQKGRICVKVKNISVEWENKEVYNLEVEKHNSYIIENFISVHNCQDISQAGKQDLNKGRSVLVNELIRCLREKQPKYFLFENVGAIETQPFKQFLREIENDLKNSGYVVFRKMLNTKNFGIPQNRERVWWIGYRKDLHTKEFGWTPYPQQEELKIKLKDILEDNVDKKYFLSEKQMQRIVDNSEKRGKPIDRRINLDVGTCLTQRQMPADMTFITNSSPREFGLHPICPTLLGRDYKEPKTVVQGCALRGRERNEDGSFNLNFEINKEEVSNSLTSVQKDSMVIVHNLQNRSSDRPSVQKALAEGKPAPGGSGHLSKSDGTSYCLDTGNTQAIQIMPTITTATGNRAGSSREYRKHCETVSVALKEKQFEQPTILDLYNDTTRTDYSTTLTNPCHNSLRLGVNNSIRRLTPKECFRLMGFLKDEINLEGLSDTQRYCLAGNGWDVNLVSKIFKSMEMK